MSMGQTRGFTDWVAGRQRGGGMRTEGNIPQAQRALLEQVSRMPEPAVNDEEEEL